MRNISLALAACCALGVTCEIQALDASAAMGATAGKVECVCVYYPHWHEYPKGNEWFHKGFNEWEFVKDTRLRVPGQKIPFRPLYGFLDGKNPADVAKEIDLASNAGIDVFLFDWYWYGGEMTMQESLEQGFLRAPNRMKMKFCLMWCYHDRVDSFRDDPRAPKRMLMKLPRTPEDFLNNIRYSKKFFHEPNHWMRDGKPFFSIYNATHFVQDMGGVEKARQLLDEARKIAIADGLAGIYFQGMVPQDAPDAKMLSDAGFDCVGNYALSGCPAAIACEKDGTCTYEYSEMFPWHQQCWERFSTTATVPYIPAVTAGRDTTMRCRNNEPFPWRTVRYPYSAICLGNTSDKFQSLLESAKKHVEADPKAPRAILIYGWNEYTEGGYIAPNNFDADGFLRAVAAVFGRKPASEYTYVNPSTKQLFTIPSATYENVPYGPHSKQKIDVFLPGGRAGARPSRGRASISGGPRSCADAGSARAPVVIYLHGGGWSGGAMEDHILGSSIRMLLDRGIAVVGTGYRYIRDAQADGVKPPVMGCLDDCEAALRFVKEHAAEWNLDTSRIGLAGGSAGACTALYLALKDGNLHGIRAVAPIIAQTSMDPQEMKAWIPNSKYGAHAFGYRNFDEWFAHRADCLADIERISPAALARKIDPVRAPRIFLQYGSPLKPGEIAKDPTHSPVFGEKFKELCAERGIPCKVNYGGKAYFGDAFTWLADAL
jgi:acetyl esterase/lipase